MGHSRYLLGREALTSTAVDEAKPIFTRLFREYGLPTRIRSDNGVPFATNTLARLSRLSAWWVRLGILPELIEPGHPEQNGRHERMHRTLKAETTRPAAGSRAAQQRRFNDFRQEFNHERPHEALDQETPAACYAPSPRPMPERLPPLEYPDRFEVRYVSANGGIRWSSRWINVSTVCMSPTAQLKSRKSLDSSRPEADGTVAAFQIVNADAYPVETTGTDVLDA
jgi:putative transposase